MPHMIGFDIGTSLLIVSIDDVGVVHDVLIASELPRALLSPITTAHYPDHPPTTFSRPATMPTLREQRVDSRLIRHTEKLTLEPPPDPPTLQHLQGTCIQT